MNDSHLFKLARECSFQSDYTGCASAKLGAIAVYKGTILAKGYNTDKTHPRQAYFNKWRYKNIGNNYLPEKMHSEIMVLEKIKYLDIDFSKVHIYIYRETKRKQLAMARPCPSCLAAIRQMNIHYIHYTTDCGYAFEKIQ